MGFLTENAITMVLIGQISNSLDQNDPDKLAQLLSADQKIIGQSSRSNILIEFLRY